MFGIALALGIVGWLVLARVRPRGEWRIGPVLLLVPALIFVGNELRWQAFEAKLADAARPVLGNTQAGFGCERLTRHFFSSSGHVGHVWFDENGTPADEAFLSMQTCAGIREWMRGDGRQDERTIVAVHTLAHEAAHLTGIRDEARAECLAMRNDEEVMTRLGATSADAAAAAQQYRVEVYPRLPAEYQGTCPPG